MDFILSSALPMILSFFSSDGEMKKLQKNLNHHGPKQISLISYWRFTLFVHYLAFYLSIRMMGWSGRGVDILDLTFVDQWQHLFLSSTEHIVLRECCGIGL